MPKNVQTTTQSHSFDTLAKWCSKSSTWSFNNTWTVKFQMFKLDLEKSVEPEIKLPASTGSLKKQENSRKNIYFCFINYAKAFDCVGHNKLWKILQEMGITHHLICLLRIKLELDMEQWTGSNLGKEYVKAVYCHPVYLTYMHRTIWEMLARWSISWNQDCWEKYQQPHICRWHDSNGRKWRGTKEPLDEGEKGWKIWLKT